ncbi:MAG: hypothetical protein HQL52_06260 [Magnetococcales bacterium]|nr:hypothetical protein [Magnetococcales bacterium]
MKRHDYEWPSNPVEHTETSLADTEHLAIKALGVAQKHFLVPMSGHDLNSWKKHDHYRRHLAELEEDGTQDAVWIRPWIVGGWLEKKACLFHFEPTEFNEEAFGQSLWHELTHWQGHRDRGALFGIYLTVSRPKENFHAVFAFRIDESQEAQKIADLPIYEALCLTLDGDREKIETWLDWAYRENN